MNWYLNVLRNYSNFEGRARRKEFWMFALFNLIFAIACMIFDNILGTTFGILPYGLLYFIYALGMFIPNLAVTVRRLHDVGKSGWWILIGLIPLVGAIWMLVLLCSDGDFGDNNYGPNPKEVIVI